MRELILTITTSKQKKNPTSHSSLSILLVLAALFAQLLLTGPASGTSPANVTVTFPLKFTVSQVGGAERVGALELKNPERMTLKWTASATQPWLRFNPASGSLAPGATVSIELIADPTGFSPGIYDATVRVASANRELEAVPVTMIEESVFAGAPIANAERVFPANSGMANVKSEYGAKGDGISDDTESIQRAMSSVVHHPQAGPRILFFPAGTYLVSRPLLEKDLNGQWNSLLTLQGENRATAILKLTDNNPLYQRVNTPAAVLKLASQHGGPQGGGNSAFDNNVFDMTIDVGRGNPAAIALDFLGNNYCALRNVVLQSSDPNHAGAAGLSMQRYASGPCLMKNILIQGFDYGIRIDQSEYSLTFEDLTLMNQNLCGMFNVDNVVSIRHLLSRNSAQAICNQTPAGLVTVVDAILQGGSDKKSAIENQGTLYARNVTSTGYASAIKNKAQVVPGTSISEYDSGPVVGDSSGQSGKQLSLNLPVEETPYHEDVDLKKWKNVVSEGADATGHKDSAAAIQAAIDSGAATIYFPTGVYTVAQTIHLRGKVRVLEGFDSSLNPSGAVFQDPDHPAPFFSVDDGAAEVAMNHMRIAAYYPRPCRGVVAIQQNSSRPFVLRDSIIGGPPTTIAYENTNTGAGTLFVENVAATRWLLSFPQKVFARQINPEGNTTKILNRGGNVWILGLKTEGTGTNIETGHGGSTEVLGGLIYPVWKVPDETPGFVVSDSRSSLIYAVSNHKPIFADSTFAVQVQETRQGNTKNILSSSLPARGFGTTTPLYRSSDLPQNSSPALKK